MLELGCIILIPLQSLQQVYGNALILWCWKKSDKPDPLVSSWWLFSLIINASFSSMLCLQKLKCFNFENFETTDIEQAWWTRIGHYITIMLTHLSLLLFRNILVNAIVKLYSYFTSARFFEASSRIKLGWRIGPLHIVWEKKLWKGMVYLLL